MSEKLNGISCPVCSSKDDFDLMEKVDEFSIYHCSHCGLQFADPLQYSIKQYEKLYDGGGSGPVSLRHLSKDDMMKKALAVIPSWHQEALRRLKDVLPPGSPVLDVGFGAGWFMAALEKERFQTMGVEVVWELVKVLGEKGFKVHLGSADSLPKEWPRPEAIVLLDVIEHVPQPIEFLASIRRLFPHALLLLTTPSWNRWTLRLGYREQHDYPPNHLLRWSEASLRLLLNRSGYEDVSFTFLGVDSSEFYNTAIEFLLVKLKLGVVRSPETALKDREGRSYLSKFVGMCPRVAVAADQRAKRLVKLLLKPLATYLTRKGSSAMSVLAIAHPRGDNGALYQDRQNHVDLSARI